MAAAPPATRLRRASYGCEPARCRTLPCDEPGDWLGAHVDFEILGGFAAGLHALKVPGQLPAADPLASLRAQLAGFEQVSPVFELALRTLEADQPPAAGRRPAI